jgi:hypothetical protein
LRGLSLNDQKAILCFPEIITKGFLDLLDEHDEQSFPELKFGRLSKFPYVTINSLSDLVSEENKASISEELFNDKAKFCKNKLVLR